MIVRERTRRRESGATDDIVVYAAPSSGSCSTSELVALGDVDPPRLHAGRGTTWQAAVRPYVIAFGLPIAEIDQPRRSSIFTGSEHIIVMGEHVRVAEPELDSIFAMRPQRPTLWLPSVPILPRRRPHISPWDSSELLNE